MTRGRVLGSIRLAIGVAALLLARVASAGFIGVEDDRLLVATCNADQLPPGGCAFNQSAAPSSPFADFDAAIGVVGPISGVGSAQDSTVTYDLLAGSGSILSNILGAGTYTFVRSLYDVTFDVGVATAYRLAGTLNVTQPGDGSVSIVLSGASTIFQVNAGFQSVNFDHAGLLEPGRYRLVAGAFAGGYGIYQPSLSYQFAMTPEPHSALLLGLGLVGLARVRGKRSR